MKCFRVPMHVSPSFLSFEQAEWVQNDQNNYFPLISPEIGKHIIPIIQGSRISTKDQKFNFPVIVPELVDFLRNEVSTSFLSEAEWVQNDQQ